MTPPRRGKCSAAPDLYASCAIDPGRRRACPGVGAVRLTSSLSAIPSSARRRLLRPHYRPLPLLFAQLPRLLAPMFQAAAVIPLARPLADDLPGPEHHAARDNAPARGADERVGR